MELLCKFGVFLLSSAVISTATVPVIDKTIGKFDPSSEDVKKQAIVRAAVSVGNIVASAAIASVVTTALYEEPEAIIEVASEFI
jgi:hypothetical protein